MTLRADILSEASLTHYWDMGETSGTTAADSKRGGAGDTPLTYTGTVTVGATGIDASDAAAKAVAFGGGHGTGSSFAFSELNGANVSFWMFALINLTSLGSGAPTFAEIFESYAAYRIAQLRHSAYNAGDLYGSIDGGTDAISAGGTIATGTTYSIGFRYNATTDVMEVLKNGVVVGTGSSPSGFTAAPVGIYVGSDSNGSAVLTGKMQHLALGTGALPTATFAAWDATARGVAGKAAPPPRRSPMHLLAR